MPREILSSQRSVEMPKRNPRDPNELFAEWKALRKRLEEEHSKPTSPEGLVNRGIAAARKKLDSFGLTLSREERRILNELISQENANKKKEDFRSTDFSY